MSYEDRIKALEHCLQFYDRSLAIISPDGMVIAATRLAHQAIGQIIHGKAFAAMAEHKLERLPATLLKAIQGGRQTKLNASTTAIVQPWGKRGKAPAALQQIELIVESKLPQPLALSKLTYSERLVFDLLITGRTNGEIAMKKGCAVSTVKHQIASCFDKLGLRRREELIAAYHATNPACDFGRNVHR